MAFNSSLKRMLVRKWSKEIMDSVSPKGKTEQVSHDCRNLAGLGGQGSIVRSITWEELLQQSKSAELRRWTHKPNVIREHFFFAYFGPLEAWCDSSLHSGYYLWSDERRINLLINDPMDHVLWKMAWSGEMPRLDEISYDGDDL